MSTMKEIAAIAGISVGTVERALNNKPGVSAKTRERVLDIANSLHYKPNRIGRALVNRNKGIRYGVILEPVSNPFFQDIKTGIDEMKTELEEVGISTDVFCMNTHREGEMLELLQYLHECKVSGIVVNVLDSPAIRHQIHAMRQDGIRIVTCSSDLTNHDRDCFVGFQHEKSGRVAAELLSKFNADKGNFLVIIGFDSLTSHMQRLSGFRAKLSESYPESSIADVIEISENDEVAMASTLHQLEIHPEINGIFVTSYGIRGVIQAVLRKGREKDIRIICYDKSDLTISYMQNGVLDALIYQSPVDQGKMALSMLNEYVTNPSESLPQEYTTDISILLCENLM